MKKIDNKNLLKDNGFKKQKIDLPESIKKEAEELANKSPTGIKCFLFTIDRRTIGVYCGIDRTNLFQKIQFESYGKDITEAIELSRVLFDNTDYKEPEKIECIGEILYKKSPNYKHYEILKNEYYRKNGYSIDGIPTQEILIDDNKNNDVYECNPLTEAENEYLDDLLKNQE